MQDDVLANSFNIYRGARCERHLYLAAGNRASPDIHIAYILRLQLPVCMQGMSIYSRGMLNCS